MTKLSPDTTRALELLRANARGSFDCEAGWANTDEGNANVQSGWLSHKWATHLSDLKKKGLYVRSRKVKMED